MSGGRAASTRALGLGQLGDAADTVNVPQPSRRLRTYPGRSCTLLALAVVSGALLVTACASTGATPRPFPVPGAATPPRIADGSAPRGDGSSGRGTIDAYALTGTALALRGTRYRDGGTDPGGFDCSGFTQYVFSQHGVALPRDVKDQFGTGKPVKPTEIAPGDLVFFSTVAPGASHVAIALGGDEFVHAPSSAGVVRVERLSSTYWSQRFIGARRLDRAN